MPAKEKFKFRSAMFGGFGITLSSPKYRYYAYGHIAHVHGWWGNRMGLGWMMWELTSSPTWLGLMAFSLSMPVMLMAPLAGAVGDRHGHRRVAMLTGSIGCLISLTIGIAALAGFASVPLLITLGVIQGTIFGFEFPSRQALIPQLVERKNISAAIAFNATTFQLGTFLGPLLAGVVIVAFGGGAAVLLYAASTAWMVIMLGRIHVEPIARTGNLDTGLLADMAAGFRYIAGNQSLWIIFALMLGTGIMIRPAIDLMPGFADKVFGRGAEGLAILNAAAGFGSFIAAAILGYRGRTQGLSLIMMGGAILGGICLLIFTRIDVLVFALVPLALASMGFLASQVGWQSLIQNMAAADMRGRVISIHSSIAVGSPALGAVLVGAIADQWGLRQALAAAGIAAVVITLFAMPIVLRRRVEMEADPSQDTGRPG